MQLSSSVLKPSVVRKKSRAFADMLAKDSPNYWGFIRISELSMTRVTGDKLRIHLDPFE